MLKNFPNVVLLIYLGEIIFLKWYHQFQEFLTKSWRLTREVETIAKINFIPVDWHAQLMWAIGFST